MAHYLSQLNIALFLHEDNYLTRKVLRIHHVLHLSVFFQYDEGRKDYGDERGSYRGDKDSYDDRERDRDYRERKRWEERERKRSDDYRWALIGNHWHNLEWLHVCIGQNAFCVVGDYVTFFFRKCGSRISSLSHQKHHS